MTTPFQVVCLARTLPDLVTSSFGPFVLHQCETLNDVAEQLRTQPCEAALIEVRNGADLERLVQWSGLAHAVLDTAVVLVAPEPTAALSIRLLQLGLMDVLPARQAEPDVLARALRMAIERKRLEDSARRAYSIDLTTGLPTHAQLLEHMTHLLALREREPAPMALIVLQLDGVRAVETALGIESANVLRRKAAVRLRSSLRASDVVASLGNDMFAVLLAWMEAEDDGERVAHKLMQSLVQRFNIAGHDVPLHATLGLGQYPMHGRDAQTLLRRAISQASAGGVGRVPGGLKAANDEDGG